MKAKRPTPARGADERRRTRTPARARRATPVPASATAAARDASARRAETARSPGPQIAPARPKNASQAKARAKARKAKAPKVVRPPLRERLLARISAIDLNPRTLVARVPFVVLVIGALGLGLGVTLWLSTDAAERSYQLGSARQTNQALLQQKEALERDVLEAQAAPALAEAARELGMIPSRDTAHLVQDPAGNWIVVGTPKPAEGVPPPPLNTPLPDDAPHRRTGRRQPAGTAAVADPREMVGPGARTRLRRRGTRRPCRDLAGVPLARAAARQPARRHAASRPRPDPPDRSGSRRRRCAARRGAAPRPAPARAARSGRRDRRRLPDVSRGTGRSAAARSQPAAPAGSGTVRPCAPHPGAGDRHRFAQRVVRVPAPGRQRRHLPGAHRRRGAAVQPAGAARRRPARRGGGPAQGHRRREGRARQHRRPQRRQAGVHHRGPRADLPAGQGPQAAGRGAGRRRPRRPTPTPGCATSPPRSRRG